MEINEIEKYDIPAPIFLENTLNIETGLNDNPIPSTSNTIENLPVTQDTHWREASFKLNKIFPDLNPEVAKEICISQTDGNLQYENLLEVAEQKILNEEKSKFEISLGITGEQIFPEEMENNILEANRNVKEQTITEPFNVEKFLVSVPNAVEFYENPERKCEYNLVMFELLKNHFRKLKISTISDAYTRKSFNPIATFESLQNEKEEIKINRKKTKISSENLKILQEFEFLVNKNAIKIFIAEQKDREKKMMQRMIDNHQLLECECCYEEIYSLSTMAISCGDGHVFCASCAMKGTEEELAKGSRRIKCFAECSSELNLNSLQKVLLPDKFKILLAKVQEEEIASAKIEGLMQCPFCHYASIPNDYETIFRCLNLDCGCISCRLCKKLNHLPKECESIERNKKARLILEEKMTAALVRKCICGKEIIKEGGCNVVTCTCGQTLCYFCGQSTVSHAHLNGRCNDTINADTDASGVVFVARKVESELLKLDPNLKIDVNSILPTASYSSATTTHALNASSTLPQL